MHTINIIFYYLLNNFNSYLIRNSIEYDHLINMKELYISGFY